MLARVLAANVLLKCNVQLNKQVACFTDENVSKKASMNVTKNWLLCNTLDSKGISKVFQKNAVVSGKITPSSVSMDVNENSPGNLLSSSTFAFLDLKTGVPNGAYI